MSTAFGWLDVPTRAVRENLGWASGDGAMAGCIVLTFEMSLLVLTTSTVRWMLMQLVVARLLSLSSRRGDAGGVRGRADGRWFGATVIWGLTRVAHSVLGVAGVVYTVGRPVALRRCSNALRKEVQPYDLLHPVHLKRRLFCAWSSTSDLGLFVPRFVHSVQQCDPRMCASSASARCRLPPSSLRVTVACLRADLWTGGVDTDIGSSLGIVGSDGVSMGILGTGGESMGIVGSAGCEIIGVIVGDGETIGMICGCGESVVVLCDAGEARLMLGDDG
jgi:hypothetical protein